VDGKFIKTATGLGGAYCTSCTITEKEGKDLDKIAAGFPINRTINDLHSLYLTLTSDCERDGEDYSVPVEQGDYLRRKGLTQKPQTHQDLTKAIPVLHCWMRSLDFFEILFYR
jgi:hypothetical protein